MGDTAASIGTPAGEWRLGWDPTRATFTARHSRHSAARGDRSRRLDHELGVSVAAYPSVGTLEEALGFVLPEPLRDALGAERDRSPALAVPRGASVPEADRPRGVDTYPTWDAETRTDPIGPASRYGLLVEQARPAAVADLGEGTRLEVLSGTPEPATGSQRVAYRLTHQGRVIFAGDDVNAPPGADLAGDDAVRALLGVLLDADPTHRARPFTHPQATFVAAHGQRLASAVEPPDHPFPPGTRVAMTVDGQRHTGTVAHAVAGRDGTVLAYAWRPDAAALVGHPWRYHPDHTLISPPDQLSATLTEPELGFPDRGAPLEFGAVVACAETASGERVEATVLRAFATAHGFVYQVQPNTPERADAFTVADDQCAMVAGTWWPTPRDVTAARQKAGIEIVPGEVLAARSAPPIGVVADGGWVAPPVSAEEQAAALTVDVDEPAPSLVKVSTHGQLTRVGDPDHGWMVVATDRWLAAMCRPADELRAAVNTSAPDVLSGGEPHPTLAALAARHAPDTLGAPPTRLAQRFASGAELTQSGVGL
jgi:hypothetical protein